MSLPNQSFDAAVCFYHASPCTLRRDAGPVVKGSCESPVSRRHLRRHGQPLLPFLPAAASFDRMVAIDPGTFPARLEAAGFGDVHVDVMKPFAFRFRAWK